jgi:hypothetical protein
MKILSIAAAGTALFLARAVPAKADTITETYDFTATAPSTSPVTIWDGSFTVTFDPTVPDTGTIALDAFSSNLPAAFNPFVAAVQTKDELVVGDNCNAFGCGAAGSNQAWLLFSVNDLGTNPSGIGVAINGEFVSNPSVTLASPVPGPIVGSGLPGLILASGGLIAW